MKSTFPILISFVAVSSILGATSFAGTQGRADQIDATNFQIDVMDHNVSVDGICKFSETEALCWKPDGSANAELTGRLTRALNSEKAYSDKVFNVTLGKKHRTVILKFTRAARSNSYLNLDISSRGANTAGWTSANSIFGGANSTDFDGTSTSYRAYDGKFDLSAKDATLSLTNMVSSPKNIVLPFQLGQFQVDGNTIEVTSIAPYKKPPQNSPTPGIVQNRPPKTVVTFNVISVTNPNSSFWLSLGDEKGTFFNYVDQDGKPVSEKQMADWQKAHPETRNYGQGPYMSPGNYSFNGFSQVASHSPSTAPSYFYINRDLCKTMVINTTSYQTYRFAGIKIEPN